MVDKHQKKRPVLPHRLFKAFTASQFMNPADKGRPKPRKNLRKDAVPTLFDIPNPPKTPVPRGTENSVRGTKRPSTNHTRQSK